MPTLADLRRRKGFFGLLLFAVAMTIAGSDSNKPQPPPKPSEELVIIVTPLGDGMYSTFMLHISKEQANELRNQNN